MTITPKVMTWEELAELPDDGMRYELVRGELRTMPPPMYQHGTLANRIGRSLERYVEGQWLGEVIRSEIGLLLTSHPDTVRAPDVAFLSAARLAEVGDVANYFLGSPDLVIEIISPTDRYAEVEEKVAEWLEHGARLVFDVNPRNRTVNVHRPGQPRRTLGIDDVLDGEDVVPGWSQPVRELFA